MADCIDSLYRPTKELTFLKSIRKNVTLWKISRLFKASFYYFSSILNPLHDILNISCLDTSFQCYSPSWSVLPLSWLKGCTFLHKTPWKLSILVTSIVYIIYFLRKWHKSLTGSRCFGTVGSPLGRFRTP